MEWAKSHEPSPYHLGTSGAPGPDAAEVARLFRFDDADAISSTGDRFGLPALRAAVARMQGVDEDSVLVSDGTSLANYTALTVLAGPGDRVLVETPTYSILDEIPRFHGALVEPLPRWPEHLWVPRMEEIRRALDAPGPPVRAIVLTRLHNPTGVDLPPPFLEELARCAEQRDFHVMLDEVYLDFIDARRGHTFSPRFLTTGSLTKVYGFGGLRVGWVIAAPEALRAVRELSFYLAVNAAAPSQHAAVRILAARERHLERTRDIAARGHAILAEWLASRDDVSCVPPAGGLIAFVRLHNVVDTTAFTERLLERDGVALAPGECFGVPGWARFGFGIEEATLREGLARVGRALDAFR
jgi:aspartate/methionine/tyrosine aminotransferase